jgi:hypothetical protein
MRRFPTMALLSFALPGLGQLAQKRLASGLAFFAAFVAAISFGWWMVPIVALLSGLDTLRVPRDSQALGPAYGVVGGVALLAWVTAFFLELLPLGRAVNEDVERIAKELTQCTSLESCVLSEPAQKLRDSWGRPYQVFPRGAHFEIRSLGPDGEAKTADDSVFVGRLLSR